ncbi:MAG: cell division protein FtsZ [Thermodesulfovibrionales bacterium]|nr:cell division protein FtsZ [Thermodesulfovibrionales bacterium]
MFELEEVIDCGARIKVIGIGGGGGNAINSMISSGITGVEFIAINTDTQALSLSLSPLKLQIGSRLTKGLGAGSNPQLGRDAAMEDASRIEEVLKGADMVFITAGMGGGTGTGGAPVVAAIAKELGILTVAVVTKPFYYEGKKRHDNAMRGIEELRKNVDSIIVIPNDRIRLIAEKGMSLTKSFELVNNVLRQAVQGITDLILKPGLINLDFADLRTVLSGAGRAVMGVGIAKGSGIEAARRAVTNPLIEESNIEGARRVLLNITGGPDMDIELVNEACSFIYDAVHEDVHLIFGAVIDEFMEDSIKVTIVAADYEKEMASDQKEKRQPEKLMKRKDEQEDTTMPSYIPSAPFRSLQGAKRILSKSLEDFELPRDLLHYDDPLDIPAFMRESEEGKRDES